MARTKLPPDEDAPEPEPASFGAVMAPYGVGSVVPRPLGVGRPRPEPEERWTLGPAHHVPASDDTAASGESDSGTEGVNPSDGPGGAGTSR